MHAKLTILDTTITPPIRPYPESQPILTNLYQALISAHNREEDFHTFQQQSGKLADTIQSLELIYQNQKIELPININNKILSYLKSPKYGEKFDCHNFISHITDTSLNQLTLTDKHNINQSAPGDIGIILDDNEAVIHRQLYLGEDLFLSKGGHLGPLIISTNDEMVKLRGGSKTMIQKYIQ